MSLIVTRCPPSFTEFASACVHEGPSTIVYKLFPRTEFEIAGRVMLESVSGTRCQDCGRSFYLKFHNTTVPLPSLKSLAEPQTHCPTMDLAGAQRFMQDLHCARCSLRDTWWRGMRGSLASGAKDPAPNSLSPPQLQPQSRQCCGPPEARRRSDLSGWRLGCRLQGLGSDC